MASSLENETFSFPTAFFSSLIAALVSIIPHMVDRQAGYPPEEKCRLSCHIRIAKRQNKADQGATKVRRGTHPTDGSAYFYIRRNDEPRSNAGMRSYNALYTLYAAASGFLVCNELLSILIRTLSADR